MGSVTMTQPKVSVLMPVYNPHPDYFRQALQSILGQTFEDWELVIVEDPAPRLARETLQECNDPRIKHYLNQERTSFLEQCNRCLFSARGSLVACLDQDDICEPTRLEKQVAFLEQNPQVTVLGTQLAIIRGDGSLVGYRRYPCEHEAIVKAMQFFDPIANPSVMFRKQAAIAAGGYQLTESPFVDYELWCRLAKRGAVFANLPEALVRYRVHLDSVTKGTRVRDTLRNTIKVKKMYWQGQMPFGARLRLLAEQLLLLLPPIFVVWLFLKTQVRAPKNAPGENL
ncbi:MAG: glycosyltransferase [Thermoanaerobaculaceae bacterium]